MSLNLKSLFAQKKKSDCCEKFCSGMWNGSGQARVNIKLGTRSNPIWPPNIWPTWPPPTPKFELQASAARPRLPWDFSLFFSCLFYFLQLCFLCGGSWIGSTCAAIRLVLPMVELSMEVMEGLRDPLIGLRCWISRCTSTSNSKASKLRSKLTKL